MLIFAVLVVGFSGLIAQVLLLRELLVGFNGNELTVGVILANWVALEAVGALVFGRAIDRIKNKLAAFVLLDIIFLIAFPLCIWGARTFKLILGIPLGLGIGIGAIFWVSLILALPVSLSHGGLFSSCAKLYSISRKSYGVCAGRVYFWETLGTIFAGVIFTYVLITRFNSFQIAGAVAFLNLIICLGLLYKRVGYRALKGLTLILLAVSVCLFSASGWDDIHRLSIKKQWRNLEVLDYANSIYGNIVVTQAQEQYTFFSNGQPAITTPYPDLVFIEEFANLPLLFHMQPRSILVISRGAGGLIDKILKVPSVEKIDYLELDPLILNMLEKYPTDLTRGELGNKRVKTINLDGRFFIKQTTSRYDVVFLGLSDPSDLQANRLFTQEFFGLVKKGLNRGGILAFTLSGSMTYLAPDLRDLNACILNSLKEIFSYVRVVPGDFNLYLASDSHDIIEADSNSINQRIEVRGIKTNLLFPSYVDYRLHPRWQNWFNDALRNATEKTNRDFSDFALFKTLCLWNAQFEPRLGGLLCVLERINLKVVLGLIFGLTLIFLIINFKIPRLGRLAVPYSIATTGFFGMLANLMIIFAFQIVYGYLYFEIGMLITSFMAGAALGSILLSRYLERIKKDLALFASLEIGIILSTLITLLLILSYPPHLIFFVLCFITGFWGGAQFPLANKILGDEKIGDGSIFHKRNFGANIGLIYSADLIGGWLAGILAGVLFLPILGLINTCIVILAFKLSSLVFLIAPRRP
jgi:spermidine synthase